MNFLMIDGQGDPNTSPSYQAAVEALFSVAYAIKFKVKKTLAIDYGVLPLEGLWWADDMAVFSARRQVGLEVDHDDHAARVRLDGAGRDTIAEVKKKKELPGARPIAFRTLSPKASAPRSCTSAPSPPKARPSARVHAFIDTLGKRSGKHHEIYLSDIRKADPAKWKTVIRQPLRD